MTLLAFIGHLIAGLGFAWALSDEEPNILQP